MTGFGKTSQTLNGKNFEIEIRSLNSKSLDLSIKLPQSLKDREMEIRTLTANILERGKIDIAITYTTENCDDAIKINQELLKSYFCKIKEIGENLGIKQWDDTTLLTALLKFQDIQKADPDVIDNNEWEQIKQFIINALRQLDNFRVQEGETLKKDFEHRIELIEKYGAEVEPLEKNRVPIIKERITARLEELKNVDIDKNRLEQELIYYIEKLDITEEKVRLKNHCKYFRETLNSQESTGKKLGFIAQEMGREINTLGSKANDSEIQKIVVMMKDELEKIKEQVLNIL